jgi:tRNA threonylcarbamoyladenosine biosynthesis protein TsaE
MGWPVTVCTDSPAATKGVAARLVPLCAPGDVILLIGDLGAGKTAFAQGFAAALGVEGPVTSPTFTLVRQYRCAGTGGVGTGGVETLIHADVYRTGSVGEVAELALAELVEERAIALVEWGDLAAPALSDDALEVTLEWPESSDATSDAADDTSDAPSGSAERRTIRIRGRGRWSERADDVARALQGSGVRPVQ